MYAYLFVNNYKHSLPITGKNTTALQLKFIEMLKKPDRNAPSKFHHTDKIFDRTEFQDNVNGERKMSQDFLLVYPPSPRDCELLLKSQYR